METALHAERDGTIAEVLVKAGDQIDAKGVHSLRSTSAIHLEALKLSRRRADDHLVSR